MLDKEDKTQDITEPVVDVEEKEEPKKQDELEVDLDPKKEGAKEEPRYVKVEELEKLQKQFDGISKTIRHIKDIPGQIAELQKVISSRFATPTQKDVAKDELDDLLEKGDWRTPVNRLAEKRFNELMEERDRQAQLRDEQNKRIGTLESNKKTVRDKYPDIDDPDSEIAKRYQKIVQSKPEYLANEFGPTLAMRDMEDELHSEGRLDEFSKKAVEKEVARQTRVGASAIPRSTVPSNSNKIMLTKEQRDFCDSVGLKYENYGKYAKKLQTTTAKEGVEV